MFPDSRRPRRFAIVISPIDTNAISIRMLYAAGKTDWIWVIAAAVETATVMT